MRISDWSSDVCSSDLAILVTPVAVRRRPGRRSTRMTRVAGAFVLFLVAAAIALPLVFAVARLPLVFLLAGAIVVLVLFLVLAAPMAGLVLVRVSPRGLRADRKSTRLNSSH